MDGDSGTEKKTKEAGTAVDVKIYIVGDQYGHGIHTLSFFSLFHYKAI